MLRSVASIRSDPLAYLGRMWRTYGDVVQFPIPRPPSYLVNDPDAVWQVLAGTGREFGKATRQYRSLAVVTGEGLLAADTEAWRAQRSLVQPAFHRSTLDQLVAYAGSAADGLADRWARAPVGSVVDVDAAMSRVTLAVVGHALFGTDLGPHADRLVRATLAALAVVIERARTPLVAPPWLPTPQNRRLARALADLDQAVRSMLDERRRNPDRTRSDMLDLLLSARDGRGDGLTGRQIRDQVVTFIVAGHETVATALTWTWALLAADPDRRRRVRAEAQAVLADAPLVLDDLTRLPYTRAVFDEALRLYPPAWLVTRNSLAPTVLGGRAVPAGALLIMSPYLVHRHPDRWPDPDRFLPERFLDGSVDRRAFLPFGAGPRQCIGREFANVEAVVLLARLAARIDLDYPDGHGVPSATPLVTLRPRDGLRLRISRG